MKSNIKFAVAFLVLLILVATVIAEEDVIYLGTYKQYQPVILTQTCDNCTYINVSKVQYPDGSISYFNSLMSQPVPGNFNYTFTNTSQLQQYIITTCGDLDGHYSCQSYRIRITSTGYESNSTTAIFILIAAFLVFCIALYQRNPIIGFFAGTLTFIGGMFVMIYGVSIIADDYTRMFAVVMIGLGLVIDAIAVVEMLQEHWGDRDDE